jgi:hypothetical protein
MGWKVMVKPKLTAQQTRWFSMAMAGLAVLMLADVFYQAGMHIAWRRWLPSASAAAPAATQPASSQPASSQPASQPASRSKDGPPSRQAEKTRSSKPHEVSAAIKRRNVFAPVPAKGHGMRLTGVLGRLALFQKGGRTVGIEEGQSAQGVKVVSIQGYEVTIEYEGKPETMKLFAKGGGGPGEAPMGAGPPGRGPTPEDLDRLRAAGASGRLRSGPRQTPSRIDASPGSATATQPAGSTPRAVRMVTPPGAGNE